MKEELIRILNYKLDDINNDIESLNDLNEKIEEENEKQNYLSGILDLFKENDTTNIMNFTKLSKEDFEKVVSMLGEDVAKVFETDSCNYDGLVYLINGINSGISLSLTNEQTNGIDYFISKLIDQQKECRSSMEGYKLVKTRFAVNDVEELKNNKEKYQSVIDNIDNNKYISDTELLLEAINFSDISKDEEVDLLTYVLEYNSEVYKNSAPIEKSYPVNESVTEDYEETENNETSEEVEKNDDYFGVDIPTENDYFGVSDDVAHKENNSEISFEEKKDADYNNEEINFNNETVELNEEEPKEELETIPEVTETEETSKDDYSEPIQEYNPYGAFTDFKTDTIQNTSQLNIPLDNNYIDNNSIDEVNNETMDEEVSEPIEVKETFNTELNNNFDVKEDYETYNTNEESTSTRELQKLFKKYDLDLDNSHLNELVTGDFYKYEEILDFLKKNELVNVFEKNNDLFVEMLLNSSRDDIEKVLRIIKEDLSVDDEDFTITTKIAVDTIPTIFVNDGGNFNNFVENVKTFKELEVNLINLFDFSKEVFVADHERIIKNLEIVKKYEIDINYKNIKYLLLISDIGERIDYYVESVYEDKLKNETFDGIDYINNYTAKLNVVTDETIKRLRYASENGKKVFGSKPKSLSGEITNLKVNALDITSEYMNKFFNNDFADLTGDEVREYVKLIHNSSNIGNYADELDMLDKYRNGLRYNIEGILVSYNKVVRNYSILRSYGISAKKALEFAVCYNLVITKEEYDKLKDLLNGIGGNE